MQKLSPFTFNQTLQSSIQMYVTKLFDSVGVVLVVLIGRAEKIVNILLTLVGLNQVEPRSFVGCNHFVRSELIGSVLSVPVSLLYRLCQ